MDTLTMLVLACVFLSEVLLTMVQGDTQLFFVVKSFREPGQEIDARSAIQCCLECERNELCKAANFHSVDELCELIEPGTALMSPEASTGWTFYYTDSKNLEHFFNAVTSQSSTWEAGFANRAIDGNTNSNFLLGSCTHTALPEEANQINTWWMVDLVADFHVERVILWNRLECWMCYARLRDLTITVSKTLDGVDDPDNVCGMYPGPPSSTSDNPVAVTCSQVMLGRYIKILKQGNTILSLCEVDFA